MHKFRQLLSELYVSIVITLLSISVWAVFVLFFRPIYYGCIPLLHIESTSGFTKDKILENYDALIDYFSPFVKGMLNLPSLTQSEFGIQHFAEVKNIFLGLYVLIPITLILLLVYVYATRKKKDLHYLKTASITMIAAPLLLGAGFLIDFDKTFTIFHKIFFRNDYWIFSPSQDPIIRMLPEEFFMICGIVIIVFQLLMSLLCYILYRRNKKSYVS